MIYARANQAMVKAIYTEGEQRVKHGESRIEDDYPDKNVTFPGVGQIKEARLAGLQDVRAERSAGNHPNFETPLYLNNLAVVELLMAEQSSGTVRASHYACAEHLFDKIARSSESDESFLPSNGEMMKVVQNNQKILSLFRHLDN